MAANYHQAMGHCLTQRWPESLGHRVSDSINMKWSGSTIKQFNCWKKKYEYWQYRKKYNTDIIINKIWQKEQETQLGLWAQSLVQ